MPNLQYFAKYYFIGKAYLQKRERMLGIFNY